MSARLAAQTQKAVGIGNGMRTATIAAVSGKTITLSISGGTITSGVGCLESYTPEVGETVAVFRQDSSWLVLGAVANSTGWGTRTGTVLMSVTAAASVTAAVSFGVTFAEAPVVVPNIESGSGTTARWVPRAINVSTTGFTMFLFAADAAAGTFSNIPVSWVATAR